MPGMPSTVRKIATPAKMTRMAMPAPVDMPANTRSPRRRTAVAGVGRCGARVLVTLFLPARMSGHGRPAAFGRPDGRALGQDALIVSTAALTF